MSISEEDDGKIKQFTTDSPRETSIESDKMATK